MDDNRKLNKSIQYLHTPTIHNRKAAMEILPYVFYLLDPKSVLDIGCGTGSWLAASKTLGVSTVKGVDGIRLDNSQIEIDENEFIKHDLTQPLDLLQKFDLTISLEVAEHLPEAASNTLVEILTRHSDVILFSAAIPGQGGQHHYNEQWPEYWNQKFQQRGFLAFDILREKFWNNEHVDWWYRQNILVFAKPKYSERLGNPTPNILAKIHPQLFNLKLQEMSSMSKAARRHLILSLMLRVKHKLNPIKG